MLKSLFGELGIGKPGPVPSGDFAATAVLESQASRLADDGRLLDHHQHELFVSGSPAQAMREHLGKTVAGEAHMITLLDPGELWAPAVIKALSDATGQPVERLHLREQASLRLLATIERTVVPRRGEATLKLYRADLRETDGESGRIPFVLMERSEMAAVIVGAMAPLAVEVLLSQLQIATREPTWRCGALLFLLPPHAAWIARRIAHIEWPASLHVEVRDEALTGSSSVWNSLLGSWDRLQPATGAPGATAAADDPLLARLLRQVLHTDGVLGCALARDDGSLVATEQRPGADVNLTGVAAALAQALRAQREAMGALGSADAVEETVSSVGARQYIVRPLLQRAGLFLFAALARPAANQALVRFKLGEAERNLA